MTNEITKLSNGKWRHRFSKVEWDSENDCLTDLRFCKEWGCK